VRFIRIRDLLTKFLKRFCEPNLCAWGLLKRLRIRFVSTIVGQHFRFAFRPTINTLYSQTVKPPRQQSTHIEVCSCYIRVSKQFTHSFTFTLTLIRTDAQREWKKSRSSWGDNWGEMGEMRGVYRLSCCQQCAMFVKCHIFCFFFFLSTKSLSY